MKTAEGTTVKKGVGSTSKTPVRSRKKPVSSESVTALRTLPSPRLMYDRKGAARQLSISVRSLDMLTANKELAFTKQGNKVMFSYAELRRYARKNHPAPLQGKPKKRIVSNPPEKPD